MSEKSRKVVKIIAIIMGALIVLPMAINWLMTYKLEDSLRKKLRAEVMKATDGFYDFSFDKLSVGFFSGELLMEGIVFYPDSSAIQTYRDSNRLPNTYFDVHIGAIDFKGINLTWLRDYRRLSFRESIVTKPVIKIYSPQREHIAMHQTATESQSLFESVSPYFDVIRSNDIRFVDAEVQYVVMDSIVSTYSLKDFQFSAHNFQLDEASQHKEHLLFSENFEFTTNAPQAIYDSEHFLFNISNIRLSTIDSLIQVGGAQLRSKEKYWERRLERPGSYNDVNVGNFELGGIVFSRNGAYNFLDARKLSINQPTIAYYDVKGEAKKEKVKKESSDSLKLVSWSLYSITSPLMERISIENIDIRKANFTYVVTKDQQSDNYKLNDLNFKAINFLVDSLHKDYNIFTYVGDFVLDASKVQGRVASKNAEVNVEKFELNSIDKLLRLSDIDVRPLSLVHDKDYIYGKIKEIEITNIKYNKGLDADLLYIESPKVDVIKAKTTAHKMKTTPKSNAKEVNKVLDAIAPFVSYVSVKGIIVNNANASFVDQSNNNKYRINDLNFYAKNFHIDEETRRLRDYFFQWDEYWLRFKNFDNITPDGKYRVQIEEGDFNSVTGNMLLRELKIIPEITDQGSYIRASTPYAMLLGLDEKGIGQKNISFKTFILESPVIEIVKEDDHTAKEMENEMKGMALKLINFDLLTIPSPSITFYDAAKKMSAQVQSVQVHVDSFRWEINKHFSMHNLMVESPYVSIVETKENEPEGEKQNIDIASFGIVDIRRLNIHHPIVKVKKPNMSIDFSAKNYSLESLYWNHTTSSVFRIKELEFNTPNLVMSERDVEGKIGKKSKPLTRNKIIKTLSTYANRTELGKISVSDLNVKHEKTKVNGTVVVNKLVDTHFLLEGVYTDLDKNKLDVGELAMKTRGIDYPLNAFYSLQIGNIDFSKRRGTLEIHKIKLDPRYPKFDFAYHHPRGADWFSVEVDKVLLSGIDASRLVSDTMLLVKKLSVDHALLENLKNQKIEIEHNPMPLLYEQFQQLPLKYNIDDLDIRDFTVIYEELAKNGYEPARIPFAQMNGRVRGFTNIQKADSAFYSLHADGLAMGTAPFVAEWKIPVDSANDRFYLTAEIKDMNMQDLNQLVRPMAPAYVKRGRINSLYFSTEASSVGARVDMKFEYDSLYLVLLRNMDSDEPHKILTKVINRWGIEEGNLGKSMRMPHMEIVRDTYHSNFNYFWQIIQPPLVESVGVTEEKQNIANNLLAIANRIKRFFGSSSPQKGK